MKSVALALIASGALFLGGCSMLKSIMDDPKQIESIFAAEAAGEYEVELRKDGEVLHTEKWSCDRGEDGKLAGCHRK